ncbi:hypothetical protein ScPMuIL_007203 [Solemya velum]
MAAVVRRIISTAKAPTGFGPYSQAVVVDKTVYVAGQIETKQSLRNIGAILEAAGSGYDKVVRVMILLDDIKNMPAINEVYATFSETLPARVTFQAAALPMGAKIEVEAIGIVGERAVTMA